MSYAEKIIAKFGGTRPMAELFDIPPSTVQSWKDAGVIPAKRHQEILDRGRDLEDPITPNDFFDMPAPGNSDEAAA